MLKFATAVVLDEKMPPERCVGVAVVGLGRSGADLLRVLGDNLDAQVRWLCDLDPSRLMKYRRCHPRAKMTSRMDRVLADPCVDAVVLATPSDTHYELTVSALLQGKHVFVQVPPATSAELADNLTNVARKRRRMVMCGHSCPHSAPLREFVQAIRAGNPVGYRGALAQVAAHGQVTARFASRRVLIAV